MLKRHANNEVSKMRRRPEVGEMLEGMSDGWTMVSGKESKLKLRGSKMELRGKRQVHQ